MKGFTKLCLLLLCVWVCMVPVAYSLSDEDYNVRTITAFNSLAFNGQSIGFQFDDLFVRVVVNSGVLNGSSSDIWIASEYGGKYVFTQSGSGSCYVHHSNDSRISNLRVNGNQYIMNNTVTLTDGNIYVIEWGVSLEPFLPIVFMVGMVGLLMLFIGPSYAVISLKRNDPLNGFLIGLIVTVFGIGFLLVWLWGSV